MSENGAVCQFGSDDRPMQHNPDPLKVVKRPKCASCGQFAPGCKCGAMDYRWPDGSKA